MERLIAKISAWVLADDPRTWAAHAIIAVVLALFLGPYLAIGYYALREAEQIFWLLVKRERLHPLDHFMDVAAPAIAVGLLSLVLF